MLSIYFLFFQITFVSAVTFKNDKRNHEFLLEEARGILSARQCGVCHVPPGNKRALEIYDLSLSNWNQSLSDAQLREFKWRIKMTDEEVLAQKGDPKKHQFTKKEINLIESFVDSELATRKPYLKIIAN